MQDHSYRGHCQGTGAIGPSHGLELRLPSADGFHHDMFKFHQLHTKGGLSLGALASPLSLTPTTTAGMGQFAEQLNSVAHLVARAAAEQVRASARRLGARSSCMF